VIVDVNKILRPNLYIVDAIIGQEGVLIGKKHEIGVVICGRNPASVDSIMAQVMQISLREIKHLTLAEKQSLSSLDPKVVGESIDNVAVRFRRSIVPIIKISRYILDSLLPLANKSYRLVQ